MRRETITTPRQSIENAIESMLAVLDMLDGDPDRESNGDELDGAYCEDEFANLNGRLGIYGSDGPGCPISDPGGCEHDGREHENGF